MKWCNVIQITNVTLNFSVWKIRRETNPVWDLYWQCGELHWRLLPTGDLGWPLLSGWLRYGHVSSSHLAQHVPPRHVSDLGQEQLLPPIWRWEALYVCQVGSGNLIMAPPTFISSYGYIRKIGILFLWSFLQSICLFASLSFQGLFNPIKEEGCFCLI